MAQKILITGGCGFVGANLVRKLLGKDMKIVVLDNLSRGNSDYLDGLEVELVQTDIRDQGACEKAFKDVDKVVHLAAYGSVVESVADPETNFEMNVRGTFNMLSIAVKYNISKLVFSSTGGALIGNAEPPVNEQSLPKPISPYGAGKLCCEAYCHAFSKSYGLNTVCLRFANVYGPYSQHKVGVINKFTQRLLNDEPLIIYGDGSSTRDYIDVSDLCDGIALALENDEVQNEVIHLATGRETSLNELAEIFKTITHKPDHPIIYKKMRAGEVEKNFALYDKAARLLKFEPTVKLEKGIEKAYKYLKIQYSI